MMMRAAALSMRCSGSVLRGALSVRTPHPWPRSLRRVHAAAATCDALGSSGEKKDLPPLPKEASVVVVGGGVIGASVGYHLSKLGQTDVVVLEQSQVTSGTTWHAAGLIGVSRASDAETRLCVEGSLLYESLEEETEQSPGFKRCGSITVARTPDRMHALHRTASRNRAFGIECHLVSPQESADLWDPQGVGLMRTDDLEGGLWIPADGTASPTDLTMALLKGARSRGVKLFEHTRVESFETVNVHGTPRASAVVTDRGTIQCETVVLCAGQWSRDMARQAGVSVPLHSAEHFYMITAPMEGVTGQQPLMRDLDAFIYFREWSGGLCMGGFEPLAKPVFTDGVPSDFAFSLFPDDWDHFDVLLQGAMHRCPPMEQASVQSMVNGPESFTPDTRYILGESPTIRNFFVATGMNSSGVAGSGGCGKAIAEWIVEGQPTSDLWAIDVRRYGAFHDNRLYLKDRVCETLGLHYAMPWPTREHTSGRNLRRSPLNAVLGARGAQWGEKFGWERPNFFCPGASEDEIQRLKEYSYGHGNWMEAVRKEADACRNSVAIFDQSSFSKFAVQGRDAAQVLNRLCANQVDVEVGRVVYTGMLNDRGGYEADVTVTRISETEFSVVSPTAQATRDMDWMTRHIAPDEFCVVTDVSGAFATISVMGPQSRELLALTERQWDDENFPFGTAQRLEVGYGMAHARRVTYVGERGWELYVPSESAVAVYDALKEAAATLGLDTPDGGVDAGYMAIDSLRVEKGYRAWGHELSPDVTPLQAGLMFAVDMNKPAFNGKDALVEALAARKAAAERGVFEGTRVLTLVLEDPCVDVLPLGNEVISIDGVGVGRVTSAAFSYTLGVPVCMGLVSHSNVFAKGFASKAAFTVQVDGKEIPAKGRVTPAFDPKNLRVKG